jgi:hypothetical protein
MELGNFATFLADACLEQVREGIRPTGETARTLMLSPVRDALIARLDRKDKSMLLEWAKDGRDLESQELAISLLKGFSSKADVQNFLWSLWKTAGPRIRCHLSWRLLESPTLPKARANKILEFITGSGYESFRDEVRSWSVSRARLAENWSVNFSGELQWVRDGVSSGPASKRWLYLLAGEAILGGIPEIRKLLDDARRKPGMLAKAAARLQKASMR